MKSDQSNSSVVLGVWRALVTVVPGARVRFGVLMLATVIAGFTDVLALTLVVQISIGLSQGNRTFDVGGPVGTIGLVTAISIAFAAAVVTILGHLLGAKLSAVLMSRFHTAMQARSIADFSETTWARQSQLRSGELQELVSAMSLRTSLMVQNLNFLLIGFVSLMIFVIAAIVVDVGAAAVLLVVGLLMILGLRPLSLRNRTESRTFIDVNGTFISEVAQFSDAAMELTAFAAIRKASKDLIGRGDVVRAQQERSAFFMGAAAMFFRDSAIVILVVCAGLLAVVSADAFLGVGIVAVLLLRAVASAQQANGAYQTISANYRSLETIEETLAELERNRPDFGDQPIPTFETLETVDAGYIYPDGRVGLKSVSLELRRGEALALSGPSGAGKSTLIELLLRLRTPSSGSISVNGQPYGVYEPIDWSRAVAIVPQMPTMFEATIAENVAYFRSFTDDEVIDALRDAGLLDEMEALPQGIHTPLGPRGQGLSGGQRQRLAIARAIIGKPGLLILDEPTSALDEASEERLMGVLHTIRDNAALVIATHRPSTLAFCDRVLEIRDGIGGTADIAIEPEPTAAEA